MKIEIDIAQRWREERGYTGKGGVVIVFNDVATAWCEALPEPRGWAPSCIAVDEDGRTWWATGGNENDGAHRWEPYGASRWMPSK